MKISHKKRKCDVERQSKAQPVERDHKAGFSLSPSTILLTALLFAALTYERSFVWREPFSLWMDAVQKSPHKARPHNNLGIAYFDKGLLEEAIAAYKRAIAINPNLVEAHNNLGSAYYKNGRIDEAIAEYKRALAINSNHAKAHYNLGMLYSTKDRVEEAMFHFRQAITINPNYVNAYNNLAWIYATCPNGAFRNGEEAVSLATKACELTNYENANLLDTLAAAYAEAGNFKKAIEYQSSAIDVSKEEDKPALLKRLELYKIGQASRSQ